MSEYKPITGELRNSMTYDITTAPDGVSTASIGIGAFCDLCDAIDSIHANLERENESLKAELDRARDEWDFWESTHVELPKDADGVPIRVGDMMKSPSGYVDIVEGILPDRYLVLRDGNWYTCRADWGFHHHAPTVEDVLTKMLEQAVGYSDAHTTVALDTIAEYAAKLRLAGDAE